MTGMAAVKPPLDQDLSDMAVSNSKIRRRENRIKAEENWRSAVNNSQNEFPEVSLRIDTSVSVSSPTTRPRCQSDLAVSIPPAPGR